MNSKIFPPTAKIALAVSRLSYDSHTGVFVWIESPSRNTKALSEAGSIDAYGYRVIRLVGKTYKAHRLAWWIYHGYMPDLDIDHINGDKCDNRIANLRLATRSQNQENQRQHHSNNSSKRLGVFKASGCARWRACINVKGKRIYLGYFSDPDAAHRAYLDAKAGMHTFSTIPKKEAPAGEDRG